MQYRLDRLPAAEARAAQFGAKGAMFPWTSELSGFDDTHMDAGAQCPPSCTGLGWKEQHISGDIAMAFRLHWRSTGDLGFLRQSWPLIDSICQVLPPPVPSSLPQLLTGFHCWDFIVGIG